MNLSGIINTSLNAVKRTAGGARLVLRAHAPEILIGTGIAGFGLTVFEACKATSKARDILDEKEERISIITEDCDKVGYSDVMVESAVKETEKHAKLAIIKAYAPVATTGIASIMLVLGGYRVLNGRYVGAAMAYKTLEAGFERYRGNVIDEFGDEVDWRMLNNVKPEDLEKAKRERDENLEIIEENKHKRFGKKPLKTKYLDIYKDVFDSYSTKWRRWWTPHQALDFAVQKENELNDKLMINGFVSENEYNDAYGFPRTKQGQVNIWIKKPGEIGGHIDVGIRHMPENELRSILGATRNEDIQVHLRPNFDGTIYDIID